VEQSPDADVVLLDLKMPGVTGFSSLLYLRQQYPGLPVIIVSAADDPVVVRRAMDFGAVGFIQKSASIAEIGEAIVAVLEGGLYFPTVDADEPQDELSQRVSSLTPQQFKVLTMLSDGTLNKQIAYDLNVSEATIKAHMTAIMRKLGVNSRTQVALVAQKLNAIDSASTTEFLGHGH
jgi:DNA-binding NarL/FixJ family response regulator